MAIIYEYAATAGYIRFDFTNEEINVENTIDELEVQELNNAIRAAEEDPIGMGYTQIATVTGKVALDATVSVGITIELLGNWVLFTEKSSGTFKVLGGNLVRFDQSDAFKPNTLVTNVFIQSANGTVVTTGGGGFTASDRTTLGNTLSETAFKDLSFNKSNTIDPATGRITQYSVNSGEVVVDVDYDETSGAPNSETAQ
jgi:hypothetical protein